MKKNKDVLTIFFFICCSSDGRATITTTAPDTITQWIISAFAVNPTSGLAVAAEMANVNICYKKIYAVVTKQWLCSLFKVVDFG